MLDAAARLIAAKGLGAVTMDEIIVEAQVSRTSLYTRWPSKDALLVDVLTRLPRRLPVELPRAREGLEAFVVQLARQGGLSGAASVSRPDPVLAERFADQFIEPERDILRTLVAQAVADGSARADVDVEAFADLVQGVVMWLGNRVALGGSDDLNAVARPVVELVWSSIATGEGFSDPHS